MFKKSKESPLVPINIAHEPSDSLPRLVVDTIDRLQLDPEDFVVVGSAAPVLYGVTPPQQPDDKGPRPGDVDLAATHHLFSSLYEQGQTPSDVAMEPKIDHVGTRQMILRGHSDASLLPVDIITRFNADRHKPAKYDNGFRKHFQANSIVVPGTENGIRVASPAHITRELKSYSRFDAKAADDLATLQKHISSK
jgi:hypothetical protein